MAQRHVKLRGVVLARDDYRCCQCGHRHKKRRDLLVAHHVIPLALGGRDAMENMETCCTDCHDVITWCFFRDHPEITTSNRPG